MEEPARTVAMHTDVDAERLTAVAAATSPATAAALFALERDGYVVLEGALHADEIALLESAVDAAWSRHRPGATSGSEPLHLLAFLGEDRRFLELLDHAATLPVVVGGLGWNIYCYHSHLDVTPPVLGRSRPRWQWHQDGTRQNADLAPPRPRLSLKVAFFLSDVSRDGRGNLRVIPGSHVRDRLDRPADGSLDPPDAIPIRVPPGSAVIFDRRLWHSRSENRSPITRKALFYAYTYRWVHPRDELRIDPEILAPLTPVRRQLLGVDAGAVDRWLPEDDDVPLRSIVPG
jgi:ectoine hydroxylase